MSELRELYQAVILDHNKKPRNFGELADANRVAHGDNPLCGDKLRLELRVEDDVVADVAFTGNGCAISTASASLMTQAVKGRSLAEVERLFEAFHELVAGPTATDRADPGLGKLAVFAGVREFPIRVKCATLAWHTLRAALERSGATVKTE